MQIVNILVDKEVLGNSFEVLFWTVIFDNRYPMIAQPMKFKVHGGCCLTEMLALGTECRQIQAKNTLTPYHCFDTLFS